MPIFFSTLFDQTTFPANIFMQNGVAIGSRHMGPLAFLEFLELHLGLSNSCSNKIERIFKYRENLHQHAKGAFYENSLKTNDLEVTIKLLSWRDELKTAGWDFKTDKSTPKRLKDLAAVEKHRIGNGTPERFCNIIEALKQHFLLPIKEIVVHEPLDLLPSYLTEIFNLLQVSGVIIKHRELPLQSNTATDLDALTSFVLDKNSSKEKTEVKADGSLQIIKFGDMLSAGKGLAALMSADINFKPVVINESGDISLSLSLQQSGLPSTGQAMQSASHPDLQLLAILPVWLWKPYQPQQILDFFLSPLNIFHKGLSSRWMSSFSENPGICLEDWIAEIEKYSFKDNPKKEKNKYKERLGFIMNMAEDSADKISIEKVINLYEYFHTIFNKRCNVETVEANKIRLKRLTNAFKEFISILQICPYKEVNLFDLQKLLQLVLQPVSITLFEKQAGSLHEIVHSGLLTDDCDDLLWFGFTGGNSVATLWDEFTTEELKWLNQKGIYLDTSDIKSKRDFWFLTQWLRFVKKRLFLIIPSVINGEPALPHSFDSFLTACFKNINEVTINVEEPAEMRLLDSKPKLTEKITINTIPTLPDYWHVDPTLLTKREKEESYSSLKNLLMYPYRWVLTYKAELYRGETWSLTGSFLFYGNLSHRIFQDLLRSPDILKISDAEVKKRYKLVAEKFIEQQGLLLHMQGEEANLKIFRDHLISKFIILLNHLKDNKWQVEGCEIHGSGIIGNETVGGYCDLLLYRTRNKKVEKAIVDLKYTGRKKYRQLMEDGADLQLAIYSKIFHPVANFCATSYFIILDGLLFTTCKDAFTNGIILRQDALYIQTYAAVLKKIENTIHFRRKEFKEGKIEVGERKCTEDLDVFLLDKENYIIPSVKDRAKSSSEYNDYETFIDTE